MARTLNRVSRQKLLCMGQQLHCMYQHSLQRLLHDCLIQCCGLNDVRPCTRVCLQQQGTLCASCYHQAGVLNDLTSGPCACACGHACGPPCGRPYAPYGHAQVRHTHSWPPWPAHTPHGRPHAALDGSHDESLPSYFPDQHSKHHTTGAATCTSRALKSLVLHASLSMRASGCFFMPHMGACTSRAAKSALCPDMMCSISSD